VATSTSKETNTGLRRGLSLWQAVGISVALMAPSMAANINPQGTAGLVGRATPLAFFLAAVAVLLIAYVFVRLCQYYQHAGSVYVFAGATLGPRAGATAGLSLLGTYTFYGLVTASATGVFGAQFLDDTGIWTDQPSWAGFVVGGLATPFDTFLWSGTIGTLILLVAYVLATIGCIKLLFVDRKMAVPMWEVVIPLAALVMLGYTMWRNVIPYPDENPARWFPIVAFGWVLLVAVVMIASPGLARRLSLSLEKVDATA